MNFLNPEEQTRIKIKKIADQPAAVPGAPAPAVKVPAPGAAKPGQPLRPAIPGQAPKPGIVPAKPGVPAPTAVAAVVKPKQPPKVQVNQVEPGVFEVHFTCSCGEQYVIRCDSANPPPAPAVEKSSTPGAAQ